MQIGLVPEYEEYTGEDALQYVISKNLHRRHLNETQRAGVASRMANMEHGGWRGNQWQAPNLELAKISIPEAAERMNVGKSTVATYRAVATVMPELVEKMDRGEMTAHEAYKKVKEKKRLEERAEIAQKGSEVEPAERWRVWQADIRTWQAPQQYDFIITDPPYPKEYLPLWETLAIRAQEWLKPGGLLVAMSGQSYLNQIYEMMSRHLTYYWTAAYLTPGQPTPLRQINVNTTWKPLLIYINDKYSGRIFGDVYKSDGNDKDFHKWGQSISGMESIVKGFCLPGQSILDPFCGAGTTGMAAINHGCFFDGIDSEQENVNISKARLSGDY
jgi:site-specific DNA-methyltransferase (adenine-specific)